MISCWCEIPGFNVVVRCCCRRDVDLCLVQSNMSIEVFLMQVHMALDPADEGRGTG